MIGGSTQSQWSLRISSLCAVALVVLVTISVFPPIAQARKRDTSHWKRIVIPKMANLVGVRVGLDTIDSLEKRIGKGAVMTGGHPQVARVWYFSNTGWTLYVDGFGLRRERTGMQEVVEEARLGKGDAFLSAKSGPHVFTTSDLDSGFWSFVPLNATYDHALALLRKKGLKPKTSADEITVEAHGYSRVDLNVPDYTLWKTILYFEKGRL